MSNFTYVCPASDTDVRWRAFIGVPIPWSVFVTSMGTVDELKQVSLIVSPVQGHELGQDSQTG